MSFSQLVTRIDEALREIDLVLSVRYNDDLSWDDRFSVVFNHRSSTMAPLIAQVGLDFDWYDPNESREADTRWYVNALEGYAERLRTLRRSLT